MRCGCPVSIVDLARVRGAVLDVRRMVTNGTGRIGAGTGRLQAGRNAIPFMRPAPSTHPPVGAI